MAIKKVKEYDDEGHITYQGPEFFRARDDAMKYGYDYSLDPRSGTSVSDGIASLRDQVNLEASRQAANGGGDYTKLLQSLGQQTGASLTDEQIIENLKKTGKTGLSFLPDDQPLNQGAGGGFTVGGMMTGVQQPKTFDETYGTGNFLTPRGQSTLGADGKYYFADGTEDTTLADAAARDAALAKLPGYNGAGVYGADALGGFNNGQSLDQIAMQTRQAALGQPGSVSPTQLLQNANAAQSQGFQYDLNSDPVWLALQEQYRRLGAQAMTDSQAQLAARTGGMASSYAGQVGQQTYDEYMRGLTDQIPTLYDAAYARWQDQQDRAAAEEERQLAAEQARMSAIYGSSGSSSSGGSSSASAKPTLTAAQTLEALKNGVVNDQTLAAYRYYYGQDWDGEAASLGVKSSSGGGGGGSYSSGGGNGDWSEVDAWVSMYGEGSLDDYLNSNYKSLGYKSKSAALSAYNNYRLSAGLYTPKSKNYDSIYKTASGYKDAAQRKKYIESATDGGMLTPEEAYEIFMLLGGDVTDTASSGTGKKPVVMSYQTVRNALAKSGSSKELWTESQWNALKQRTGTGAKTYKDYLQNMYDLYG